VNPYSTSSSCRLPSATSILDLLAASAGRLASLVSPGLPTPDGEASPTDRGTGRTVVGVTGPAMTESDTFIAGVYQADFATNCSQFTSTKRQDVTYKLVGTIAKMHTLQVHTPN